MEQTIPTTRSGAVLSAGATRSECEVTEVVDGLHHVRRETTTLGFVLRVGRVYVALCGPVYNTAIEVGQTLDFDEAVGFVERG